VPVALRGGLDRPTARDGNAGSIFLILMLETFPETRWLANVMGMGGPEPDAPESDAPDPGEPAIGPTESPSVSP
jgi:hypothetical protein